MLPIISILVANACFFNSPFKCTFYYSNYALLRNSNLSHSTVGFLILRNPEPASQLNSYLRFLKIRNYGLPNQPCSPQFLNLRYPPTKI